VSAARQARHGARQKSKMQINVFINVNSCDFLFARLSVRRAFLNYAKRTGSERINRCFDGDHPNISDHVWSLEEIVGLIMA
jgi:hypothetical protein